MKKPVILKTAPLVKPIPPFAVNILEDMHITRVRRLGNVENDGFFEFMVIELAIDSEDVDDEPFQEGTSSVSYFLSRNPVQKIKGRRVTDTVFIGHCERGVNDDYFLHCTLDTKGILVAELEFMGVTP
jgi:hypothetical protein